MPQFAVHQNPNLATRATIPLLLDVQSDLIEELGTRVVIPLYAAAAMQGRAVRTLMPAVEFEGRPYVAVTPQLAGVPRRDLGPPVGDLASQRSEIIAALDLLVTGI
jgi:toxin CcdB